MSSPSYVPLTVPFSVVPEDASVKIVELLPTSLFPKHDGPLRQTAFLHVWSFEKQSRSALIQIELNGECVEASETALHPGENKIKLGIPDIEAPTPIVACVQWLASTSKATWEGMWQPQRKWKVYLVKASHYDLGYDGRIDVMQNDAAEFLDLAKRLCTDWDQGHGWHYHIEHMRFIRAYEAERSESALRELVENYLKKGAMTLQGNPGGPHFHWMDYEQLARACYPARREMIDRFGLDVRSLSVVDNPSASWPSYQLFAQAGFKYLLRFGAGMRMGSYRQLGVPVIAWMQGPNGKDRILCSFHETYGENLWLGDGGGYGAYMIEEAALRLSERLHKLEAGERGPYPYDALIVPNYVDWEVPHENERALAQWGSEFHYPELHWDDASQALAHIEKHFASQIPVISADTGNGSGDYASIDPRSQGTKRRTTRLLAFAEGVNALASAKDAGHVYPGKMLNDQYIDLVEYDEHCWPTMLDATDVNIFNTSVAKPQCVQRVARRVDESLRRAMEVLGGTDDSASAEGATVWNSLAHPRTGLVELEIAPEAIPGSVVDSRDGKKIVFQATRGGKLQFVAEDVPAYGYRRFDFSEPPTARANPDRFEVIENDELLSLQNACYRITFDKRRGRVASLYSFQTKRELLDSEAAHGLNDWLRCHTAQFTYTTSSKNMEISKIGCSTARIIERGPVSATLEVATSDETLGVGFMTRYVLYDGLDHLDVINDVTRADFLHTPAMQRYTENIFICFPFQVPDYEFHVEQGPGVFNPATDFFASPTDYVNANRWVDVSGKDFGVTLVPHEASTLHLGQINYNQFRWKFHASTSHLYSYAWSNRMAGLVTLCLDDFKTKLSYSIRAHTGDWRQGGAPDFGWRQASPLIAVPSPALGTEHGAGQSFLSVDDPHAHVTVFKRAERPGEGYIVRLVEVAGLNHAAVRVTFDIGKIESAYLCDGVENDLRQLPVRDNGITLPLGKFDLATIRLCVGESILLAISEVKARPMGDSVVELAWTALGVPGAPGSCGYHIYRSEDPEAPPTLHALAGYTEATVYEDTGLKPGTLYFYRIAAATRHNRQGLVSVQVSVRTTLENRTPPLPVRDLGVVPLDEDRLAIYWRRSREPDIAHYEVHRSGQPDFPAGNETRVKVVRPDRYEYLIYDDSNVRAGETWYYRVFPVDFAGNVQAESDCASGRVPTMKRFPAQCRKV